MYEQHRPRPGLTYAARVGPIVKLEFLLDWNWTYSVRIDSTSGSTRPVRIRKSGAIVSVLGWRIRCGSDTSSIITDLLARPGDRTRPIPDTSPPSYLELLPPDLFRMFLGYRERIHTPIRWKSISPGHMLRDETHRYIDTWVAPNGRRICDTSRFSSLHNKDFRFMETRFVVTGEMRNPKWHLMIQAGRSASLPVGRHNCIDIYPSNKLLTVTDRWGTSTMCGGTYESFIRFLDRPPIQYEKVSGCLELAIVSVAVNNMRVDDRYEMDNWIRYNT
jgi:hypothetical protein